MLSLVRGCILRGSLPSKDLKHSIVPSFEFLALVLTFNEDFEVVLVDRTSPRVEVTSLCDFTSFFLSKPIYVSVWDSGQFLRFEMDEILSWWLFQSVIVCKLQSASMIVSNFEDYS